MALDVGMMELCTAGGALERAPLGRGSGMPGIVRPFVPGSVLEEPGWAEGPRGGHSLWDVQEFPPRC